MPSAASSWRWPGGITGGAALLVLAQLATGNPCACLHHRRPALGPAGAGGGLFLGLVWEIGPPVNLPRWGKESPPRRGRF